MIRARHGSVFCHRHSILDYLVGLGTLPVFGINLHSYRYVSEVTYQLERSYFIRRFGFGVFGKRWAKQKRASPQDAFEQDLGSFQLQPELRLRNCGQVGVGEGVITYLMPLINLSLQ